MSYSPQSRNVRFWPGWEEVPVSLNVIREGVAPNVEIQGRGDDGAGSEESIGTCFGPTSHSAPSIYRSPKRTASEPLRRCSTRTLARRSPAQIAFLSI